MFKRPKTDTLIIFPIYDFMTQHHLYTDHVITGVPTRTSRVLIKLANRQIQQRRSEMADLPLLEVVHQLHQLQQQTKEL